MAHNEVFAVVEEIPAADGRIYLRLADGRGWAFDNSALMPHSPSVVKGNWVPVGLRSTHQGSVSLASTQWEPMEEPMAPEAMKKRRRRKRGGVKRNKNKHKNAAVVTMPDSSCESEADAETEVPSSDAGMLEEEEMLSEPEVSAAEMPAKVVVAA